MIEICYNNLKRKRGATFLIRSELYDAIAYNTNTQGTTWCSGWADWIPNGLNQYQSLLVGIEYHFQIESLSDSVRKGVKQK